MNELRKTMLQTARDNFDRGKSKSFNGAVDALFDAVIKALPPLRNPPDDSYDLGYNQAIIEVENRLTAAKSPDREQVKERT